MDALQSHSVTHDIRLECDDGQVTAHRAVLSLASPVLHRLLYGEMPPPAADGFLAVLTLPSKSVKTISDFVTYCYSGNIASDCDSAALLHLADEYALDQLKADLEPGLIAGLSWQTCIDALLWGLQFDLCKLVSAAQSALLADFASVAALDVFGRVPAHELSALLKLDRLVVRSEHVRRHHASPPPLYLLACPVLLTSPHSPPRLSSLTSTVCAFRAARLRIHRPLVAAAARRRRMRLRQR